MEKTIRLDIKIELGDEKYCNGCRWLGKYELIYGYHCGLRIYQDFLTRLPGDLFVRPKECINREIYAGKSTEMVR